MTIQACILEIKNAAKNAGVELLEEEVLDILDILEHRFRKRGGSVKSQSDLDGLVAEAAEITRQAKINAAVQKRNRLINTKRYAELKQRIDASPNDRGRVLSDLMVGSLQNTEAGRLSIDARGQAVMTDSTGLLLAELQRNDLVELFASGQMDELVYRELFDGFGSTKNKEAQQIAEAIQKVQKSLLRRKNRLGANIRELRNYVVRQSHDPMLMRDAGYDQWKNDILPLLDRDLTFKNLSPGQTEEQFLRKTYDALVSGIHQKTTSVFETDGDVDPLTAFKGPANLAKKLSAERVLHFVDGRSSHTYTQKYSRMKLSESVLNGLTHDAQSIALMEVFGTNPQAMFDRLMKESKDSLVGDPKLLDKFKERSLRNQFAELDGSTRARGAGKPVFMGVDFAGIGAAWRMIQNMAKLGFATVSSMSDIATKAAFIAQTTDRGVFAAYAQSFGDIFSGFKSKEQKELAYLLNVGVENFLGDVHARFGANDSGPGMIAKAHQFFFKANGMQWWNDAQKTGLARMLAADLANYKKMSFDRLPEATQTQLSIYGISPQEWGLFKDLDAKAVDGREYLVPSVVDELQPQQIDSIIRDQTGSLNITDDMRQDFLDGLRTKLATYYTDTADTAIPTPGARERAIMNQGYPRGTIAGEAIRAVMQLKGFPITYITKGLGRQYYGAGGGKSGALGVVQMMIGTTIMGYLAMSMKDILRGKEPKSVFNKETFVNPKTLQMAFLQGGGAGIFGDYLFGEFNRYGQSFSQTVLGPSFGAIDDVAGMFAKFRNGDEVAADAVNFGLRNTPFINLFYTKTAMDYLFLYGLTDHMNPGYLRRMEGRIEKEHDQQFFFAPSRYALQPFN